VAQVDRAFGGSRSIGLERQVANGILGGLAGGVVFGMMMAMMGFLPMIAALVGSQSAIVGLVVHMVISAGIGAGFGLVLGRLSSSLVGFLAVGVVYGAIWWVLGPLTIMPVMLGLGLQWSIAAAGANLLSLMGHMVYGAVLGVVYSLLVSRT
jgi:uncharacterized membrane protein YagU involved in acid resistance